jgi:acyl-CoA synthetase (AMP-forming)/AMP-acid ligase II
MPATLVFADREIGWTAFDGAAQRAAGGFERLGVADGDVVCIMLRNEPAFLEAVFAARRLGAYPCPINWHYKADEAGWILADSGAKVLVVAADLLPTIERAIPPGVVVIVARPAAATVRASDMVISGGVNIYPAEIEAVLAAMPGVRDCAVFGMPDAEFGEALAAAVQPEPGTRLEADSIRAFLAARIAGYKVPRAIEFHAELPREESGKIFKRRLREPYWVKAGRRI